MGLLNSALHIGRNALLGSQGALQIVGNNVSSAASPDYTRLTPQLDPVHGTPIVEGLQPGAGVALTGIRRNIDEALEGRLRLANGDRESAFAQQASLSQLETFFDDVNGTGVGAQLTSFFHGFDDLANAPEDVAVRDLALAHGDQLISTMHALRANMARLSADADAQIAAIVKDADRIVADVAEINRQIARSESGTPAEDNALRDRRDGLLRQLSTYFDITVRQQGNGAVNVYVGSETLVQGNTVRRLVADEELAHGVTRTSVRFADTNAQITINGGKLGGLIMSRDEHGIAQIAALDRLADALIYDVNRIHADGQGRAGYSDVTGSVEVLASGAALDSPAAGLAHPPINGSFYLTTIDNATGTPVAHRIDVNLDGSDAGTTLEALVADINAGVTGVTASVTPDNRLRIAAADGFRFTFGHDGQDTRADTSGVLAALGVNTLLTGTDASDIGLNAAIVERPELLAASSVFLSGDGRTAGRLAELDNTATALLDGTSLNGFYNAIAGGVAVATASINDESEASNAVYLSLSAQREAISGVNLDEEAINLLKYQRSFQGAARFVSVVDELIGELVTLIR